LTHLRHIRGPKYTRVNISVSKHNLTSVFKVYKTVSYNHLFCLKFQPHFTLICSVIRKCKVNAKEMCGTLRFLIHEFNIILVPCSKMISQCLSKFFFCFFVEYPPNDGGKRLKHVGGLLYVCIFLYFCIEVLCSYWNKQCQTLTADIFGN